MEIDRCVVVGAEECDWILCEAYHQWRLARTPLAEGAAAVVLTRTGPAVVTTDPGQTFFKRADAATALKDVMERLDARRAGPEVAVLSANGFVRRSSGAQRDRSIFSLDRQPHSQARVRRGSRCERS
jgi:hypothetical protein